MGIFDKKGLFEKIEHAAGLSEAARAQRKARKLEELIADEPKNIEAWEQLAQCYEAIQQIPELRNCYKKLGNLYQAARELDIALGYYERAEALYPTPNIAIMKERISLLFQRQRLEEAYVLSRAVIETYIKSGERDGALNFLRLLPSFGPTNARYRRELAEMIPGKEGKSQSLLRSTWRSIQKFTPDHQTANKSANPGELVIMEPVLELPQGELVSNLFANIEPAQQPVAATSFLQPELIDNTIAEPVASAETETADVAMMPSVDMSSWKILILGQDKTWRAAIFSQIAALGCQIFAAGSAHEAQRYFTLGLPTLVVAQQAQNDWEWYHLYTQMQASGETCDIPFICLNQSQQSADLIQALSFGISDCWHWPMDADELMARIQHAVQIAYDERNAVLGMLQEISLPDVMQMLEGCRKTGSLILKDGQRSGVIYFNDGRPIDAQFSRWNGEAAAFRLIQWTEGIFRFQSNQTSRHEQINETVQGLLMEAMRRIDEQAKIIETLPTPNQVLFFTPAPNSSAVLSPSFPKIKPLFDGQRALGEILVELEMDVDALELVANLYQRGILAVRMAE